jgi:hypothetical protein
MICTNERKLAEIIAMRVSKDCYSCKFENVSGICNIFNKNTIGISLNNRLPECKEMFKEVSDGTK